MFESHSVGGRVGSIRINEINGEKVWNISLGVRHDKDKTVWYDLPFWGEKAEQLEKMRVEKGAKLVVQLYQAWPDCYGKDGKTVLIMKGRVSHFAVMEDKKD